MSKEEIYDFATSESTVTAVKERRRDKRDSFAEKIQKETIKNKCKNVVNKYPVLSADFSRFDSISKGQGKDAECVSEGGAIFHSTEGRDPFEDSKALDGLVYFKNKETNKNLDVYFFLKHTDEQGGYQSSITYEVSDLKRNFEKNKEEWSVLIFMLEGGFWDNFEKRYPKVVSKYGGLSGFFGGKKMFYATTDNMEETLINVLKNNNLI